MSDTSTYRTLRSWKTWAAPSTPIEVRQSRIQGRGVFATGAIRKGKRVCEYTGEWISHPEADKRYDDDDESGRHHTFLFVLDDRVVVDGRHGGNIAKYINHSCDGNCETVIEDDHIWVVATRAIRAGEELTYDYRYDWDDDYGPKDIRYYRCRCGSTKCRGTILLVPQRMRATVKRWLAGENTRRPSRGATRVKRAKHHDNPARRAAKRGRKQRTRNA
ncbi:MAG: SET domain-containing protein [Gemmatimonadaceae bacterium]|nr:SET domain-containing protein [Gemmatimonadaceae bacterium]